MAKPKPDVAEHRKRILDAALSLIHHQGFDALTMKSLASESEMAVGKLYRFFTSKDAIFLEVEILFFQRLLALLDEIEDRLPKDPVSRLQQIVVAFFHYANQNIELYRLVSHPPKVYGDYLGTEHETLAARELDCALRVLNRLRQHLLAALPRQQAEVDISEAHLQTRFLFLLNSLHGLLLNIHSRILPYVALSPNELSQSRYEQPGPDSESTQLLIEKQLHLMVHSALGL